MIKRLSDRVPVSFSCEYFGVCRSQYYSWKNGVSPPSLNVKSVVCEAIKSSFKGSGETYGSPRIWKDLKANGIQVSENTVAKYMREIGLDARLKKKFKVQTTDSNHDGPIAPRLFKAEDEHALPKAPGELLVGDITYLRLGTRFIYLAVVLDLFNREVVGWSMGRTLETDLVLRALDGAMRKVGPDAEVIFHSDRGSQYASEAYRNMLKKNNVIPSMSRKGNCYDNCYVESWFASLKKEKVYRSRYSTESELRTLVFEYIVSHHNHTS